MVQITYNFKDQFVDNSKNTNIYIACFTTSHARLMLYNKLDYLNEKVLYFDTDSRKLRELVAKGPKYREPNRVNWKATETMLLESIDLYAKN